MVINGSKTPTINPFLSEKQDNVMDCDELLIIIELPGISKVGEIDLELRTRNVRKRLCEIFVIFWNLTQIWNKISSIYKKWKIFFKHKFTKRYWTSKRSICKVWQKRQNFTSSCKVIVLTFEIFFNSFFIYFYINKIILYFSNFLP